MSAQGQQKTISEIFDVPNNPSKVRINLSYLQHLGENYRDAPHAGMVYDAIVRTQEMLCGDSPPSLHDFTDALMYNRDAVHRQTINLSNVCFAEHMRLQDKEKLAEKFFKVRGLLKDSETVNFKKYEENRRFLAGMDLKTRSSAIDLLDEIEVSNQVIAGVKKSEIHLLSEIDFFDQWVDGPEFGAFTQAYGFLQYTMTRVHERKSTAKSKLVAVS